MIHTRTTSTPLSWSTESLQPSVSRLPVFDLAFRQALSRVCNEEHNPGCYAHDVGNFFPPRETVIGTRCCENARQNRDTDRQGTKKGIAAGLPSPMGCIGTRIETTSGREGREKKKPFPVAVTKLVTKNLLPISASSLQTSDMDPDSIMDFDDIMAPPTPVPPTGEAEWIEMIGPERVHRLDRQIRLWGFRGQVCIDRANVLLLNASAVGCEVLKSLILPGFGSFCIWDHRRVTCRDLGKNFFLTRSDLGKPRAAAATRYLAELSPDAQGSWFGWNVEKVLLRNPSALDGFNYIIATQLPFRVLSHLSRLCASKKPGVFLFPVRSYGLAAYCRVSYSGPHFIVESKLDNEVQDLRISEPWGDLERFAEAQSDLEAMSERDFSTTPWIVILLVAKKRWLEMHGGCPPRQREEKALFQEFVTNMNFSGKVFANFDEARTNSYQAFIQRAIPKQVLDALYSERADPDKLTPDTPLFWYYASAVRSFYENEGMKKVLPLQGSIPDMHSDTDRYIRLQSLYRRKHRSDVAVVRRYLEGLFQHSGKSMETFPDDMAISFFCKHAINIRVINYRPLHEELEMETVNHSALTSELWQVDTPVIQYVGIRACDQFREDKGKYPGENMDDDLDLEAAQLMPYMKSILVNHFRADLAKTPFNDELLLKYARSFARYGASEIHTISSVLGGVVSQEVIKIASQQRVSLQNTWIFSGVTSKATAMEL